MTKMRIIPSILLLLAMENTVLENIAMPAVGDAEPGPTQQGATPYAEVRNPAVLSGLKVTTGNGKLRVHAGRAKIGDKAVDLKADAILEVSAPEPIPVKETVKLWPDPPRRWQSRTRLNGRSLGNFIAAPGMMVPGSARFRDSNGTLYKLNRDYVLDEEWNAAALKKGSRMKAGTPYIAEYQLGPKALDAVVLCSSGKARVLKGKPALRNPLPPEHPKDCVVLAYLYWPGAGRTMLRQENVFPKGPEWKPPAQALKMSSRIPATMAKLKSGNKVSIVCWGDSVTVGGDADPREEKRYSTLFDKALRKRYPNVTVHNVAAGGSNSRQWTEPDNPSAVKRWGDKRPRWEWIAEKKPDLVTIEFVNDCGLTRWKEFNRQYSLILKRIRKLNAEVILITPHFTMFAMMGSTSMRQEDSRPYVKNLRRFAAEHNLALADASRRWAHLWKEGLPYLSLLNNGINHPDNRGHAIFAEELMRCFEE